MPLRLTRLLGATTLAALPIWTASDAAAVTPPPVDASLLPKPAPPAPPQRTEQQRQCVGSSSEPAAEKSTGQLEDIDLPNIWQLTRGAGQTVAVIDTGVSRHRLLPHLVPGGDFVSVGDGTTDCDGHGTIVAGIIGAAHDPNDARAFAGIAPDASIIGIRQSSTRFRAADDPSGSGFGDVDTLATAVRTAADMGATVINLSSVACLPANVDLDDRALGAALSYAVDVKNVVVVSAAGNVGGQCVEQNPASEHSGERDWNGVKTVVSPAWYDDYVLTVGSVGPDGEPSQFSLAGPWVDVAAPGEHVVSLDTDGEGLIDKLPSERGEVPLSGTSYAAPVVSGIVALMRSRSPELTARQVMQRVKDTAHRPSAGWNPVVGHGVVDAYAAISGGSSRPSAPGHPPAVSVPVSIPADQRPTVFAVRGTAVCVGVCIAVVAMSLSASRLRRRGGAVSLD
jgi:membrane-anchored mycosin MYCP